MPRPLRAAPRRRPAEEEVGADAPPAAITCSARFDGELHARDADPDRPPRRTRFYAAQTFSDMPDGRRVQIGWGRMPSPGNVVQPDDVRPLRADPRSTPEGPRLRWRPVEELDALRAGTKVAITSPAPLKPGENPLAAVHGELFDIVAELELGDTSAAGFNIRGTEVVYDAGSTSSTARTAGPPADARRTGPVADPRRPDLDRDPRRRRPGLHAHGRITEAGEHFIGGVFPRRHRHAAHASCV